MDFEVSPLALRRAPADLTELADRVRAELTGAYHVEVVEDRQAVHRTLPTHRQRPHGEMPHIRWQTSARTRPLPCHSN